MKGTTKFVVTCIFENLLIIVHILLFPAVLNQMYRQRLFLTLDQF